MKDWIARNWHTTLLGLLLVGTLTAGALLLWKFFTTPFHGTDTAAKVVVGGLALIGVLVTAIVSLIGLVLKQSVDRRTLEVTQGEQRRMQLEAAVQTVKLMSLDSGAPAPADRVRLHCWF